MSRIFSRIAITTMAITTASGIGLTPETIQAQPFPNIARTPGELLSGPIAPEQGRTAIIAWHGGRIVSVPEGPGSQPGADRYIRVTDISDPTDPQVTTYEARATGFHAHGYFKTGEHLYVGPHCTLTDLTDCDNGGTPVYSDSFRIGGPGLQIGDSGLTRANVDDTGLEIGGINKSGSQSPWGAEDFWSYSAVGGDSFLAVIRNPGEYIYDWSNGGARTGNAITATWDHLGQTGVVGFPFIMGNILVYASDMTGTGVCTYDISDPTNPVLLDVLKEENPGGYWPEVYGHYVFFPRRDDEGGAGSSAGFMVVDFSDPTDLRVVADRDLPGSNQYVTFQDEYAFMNNYKIDMRDFEVELTLATNNTTLDASQFALPVGNLVVTGGYGNLGPGLAIWAHQAEPDTRSPYVLYHVPQPGQTNYSTQCPITLSIPETLDTETIIDGVTLIVRPVGGSSIPTWHSFGQGKLLTVTPQQPLLDNTTYEVILTSGIQDAMGNGLEPYSFTFSTGSLLTGNQPPEVLSINANPSIAQPGENIAFTWSGSDPEDLTPEFRIDFGDGTDRTVWSEDTTTSHTYTDAGHYQVTVQVRDDEGSVAALSQTLTVVDPPADPGATNSSRIIPDLAERRIYTTNPDNWSVTAIDADTHAIIWESTVGEHPSSVALADDGTLWVTCRDADVIEIIDSATGDSVSTIPFDYGARPVAICQTPDGQEMLITAEGDGVLYRYSSTTRTLIDSVDLGPFPRAIAITADSSRALVTRFISAEHQGSVYDVNLSGAMSLTRTIRLGRQHLVDSSANGRGVPNYLAGITISPNGDYAWVVGKKDNTTRGTYFSTNLELTHDSTVRATTVLIDLLNNSEATQYRFDIDNSDSPSAIDFSTNGDWAFITLQGNNQVAVIDVLDFINPANPGTVETRWETGLAPQGIVYDPITNTLFTADLMDRTVSALDIDDFIVSGSGNVSRQAINTVTRERFNEDVLIGKQIFYNAADPRMSAEGYISCATCHVDGGHDGRTWDFHSRGEGFRNTTDLRGRSGLWHGNVHWTANFDEIQDFENDMRNGFGGTGFLTDGEFISVSDTLGSPKAGLNQNLDALADYVTFLGTESVSRSPHRDSSGDLTPAALTGLSLFNANNCATCHTPSNDYTDRLRHDVGTARDLSGDRLGSPNTEIDTPTLLGLHDGSPYLHHGQASTLEEVFTTAGGLQLPAESYTLSNAVNAENLSWYPMKEWYGSVYVGYSDGGWATYENITTSNAGEGYVDIRYSISYNAVEVTVSNGVDSEAVFLPATPNSPSFVGNEWRVARFPLNFASGTDDITVTRSGGFGQLRIDDIQIVTPDHLLAANAHVRGFTQQELDDLSAYLLSLDCESAAQPQLLVEREANSVNDSVDIITFAGGEMTKTVQYEFSNTGDGPLNIGQIYFSIPDNIKSTKATAPIAQIMSSGSSPNTLPGETQTLEFEITSAGIGQLLDIEAWSDSGDDVDMTWTIDIQEDASNIEDAFILED